MTVGELIVKIGVDQSQFNKAMSKAEGQAKAAGSKIGDIFKIAFSVTLGMGFFEALKQGFKSTIGTAIDFNSMLQTARIGFTTMLGSAEKAQAFLDKMADFAARTPFEYPDLLQASKRMLAYGFSAEEVLPVLRAVGDATAALGMGNEGIDRIVLALGQMRAKGKASGEEMRQLAEAGIPAWEILAESIGKTTAETMKLAEQGVIPAGQAINALVTGMSKRFGGMMQQMENTWMGVTSTIKDVWRMTIGALTQNLFKGVNQWLIKVRDFAQQFYNAFQAGKFKSIAVGFANFWSMLKIAAMSGVYGIISALSVLFRLIPGLNNVLASSSKALLAAIEKEKAVMQARSTAVQATAETQQTTSTVTQQATGSIEEQTEAMQEANKAASKNLQSFDEVHQIQQDMADAASNVAGGMLDMAGVDISAPAAVVEEAPAADVNVFSDFWRNVTDIFQTGISKLTDVYRLFGQKTDETKRIIIGVWTEASDFLGEVFGFIYDVAVQVWNELGNFFKNNSDLIKNTIITAWDTTNTMLLGEWNNISNFAKASFNSLRDFWGQHGESVKQSLTASWTNILYSMNSIWNIINELARITFGSLEEFWRTHGSTVRNIFAQAWNLTWTSLYTVWYIITSYARIIFGSLEEFWRKHGESIKQTLINTWNTIMAIVRPIWNILYNVAITIFNAMKDFWKEHGDKVMDFLTTTWELIWTIIKPIWDTILAAAKIIFGALELFWKMWGDNITRFFKDTFDFIGDIFGGALDIITGLFKVFIGIFTGDWEKAWEGVKQIFDGIWNGLIGSAFNWGKNFVQNIVDGIKSMIDKVRDAAKNVADSIKGFLGFQSPTELGPGRDADKWAPSLMRMYTEGILSNIGMVEAAAARVAESLSSMAAAPVPAFAGAATTTGGNTRGYTPLPAPEVHLHIGTLIADDYGLKKLEQKLRDIRISEEQRLGSDVK